MRPMCKHVVDEVGPPALRVEINFDTMTFGRKLIDYGSDKNTRNGDRPTPTK